MYRSAWGVVPQLRPVSCLELKSGSRSGRNVRYPRTCPRPFRCSRGYRPWLHRSTRHRVKYNLNQKREYDWADPEEWVRARTVAFLIVSKNYPANRIRKFKFPAAPQTIGRTSSYMLMTAARNRISLSKQGSGTDETEPRPRRRAVVRQRQLVEGPVSGSTTRGTNIISSTSPTSLPRSAPRT